MSNAGLDVTLLARGARYTHICEKGITIKNENDNTTITVPAKAINAIPPDAKYDCIITLMRKNYALAFVQQLSQLNWSNTHYLILGNNVMGFTEYETMLDPNRIILGFGGASGHVEADQSVRALFRQELPMYLGNKSGTSSDILNAIQSELAKCGIQVFIEKNIDAWLKHHAALIIPLAAVLRKTGGNIFHLSQNRDLLLEGIEGMRESMKVLKRMGYPVCPRALNIFRYVPKRILLSMLAKRLGTEKANVALSLHASTAHEEMVLIAEELKAVLESSKIQTPKCDKLFNYLISR